MTSEEYRPDLATIDFRCDLCGFNGYVTSAELTKHRARCAEPAAVPESAIEPLRQYALSCLETQIHSMHIGLRFGASSAAIYATHAAHLAQMLYPAESAIEPEPQMMSEGLPDCQCGDESEEHTAQGKCRQATYDPRVNRWVDCACPGYVAASSAIEVAPHPKEKANAPQSDDASDLCSRHGDSPASRTGSVVDMVPEGSAVAPRERVEGKTDLQRIQESYSGGSQSYRPSVAPREAQRKTGIVVSCAVCRHRKKPRGRSAPVDLHMCDSECPGYDQAPLVGDLWPGETEEEFGYPCSDNGTTAAMPSEVAPSREQKLEDALREVLDLLSFHEGSGVPAGSGNSVIVVNEEDWNTALRVARAALEAK